MANTTPVQVQGTTETWPIVEPAKVPWGLSSIIGLLGIVGVVLGAIDSNDAVTAVSGLATIAAQVSRGRQAVELIRAGARAAKPWVDAAADLPDQT